eukprot:2549329-Rhodomonas_salina.1
MCGGARAASIPILDDVLAAQRAGSNSPESRGACSLLDLPQRVVEEHAEFLSAALRCITASDMHMDEDDASMFSLAKLWEPLAGAHARSAAEQLCVLQSLQEVLDRLFALVAHLDQHAAAQGRAQDLLRSFRRGLA